MKLLEKISSVKNKSKNIQKNLSFSVLDLGLEVEKIKKAQSEQINFLKRIELFERENFYANVFRDCICNSDWLFDKSFTLTGGAANYSFMFVIYKILEDIKPFNILEFGLGQTSKITTQYVVNKNQQAYLAIIEHDKDWINAFNKNLILNDRTKICYKDLVKTFIDGVEVDKYDVLDDITGLKRFDFIIIDGPFGFDRTYPRTNVLDIIPKNLAQEFVILLDDAERLGEQNTAKLIFNKLEEHNIEYLKSYKNGLKKQLIITSPNYKFIHWL